MNNDSETAAPHPVEGEPSGNSDSARPRAVAILSESPADEACIAIIAEAVIGAPIVPFQPPLHRRPNGWPSVLNLLPVLTWYLYHRTNAEGLIVVVDADDTSVHPDGKDNRRNQIRHCLEGIVRKFDSSRAFPTAVGVAAPALEAWLLAQRHPKINERPWHALTVPGNGRPLRQQYKRMLYHTHSPSLQLSTRRMVAAAHQMTPHLDSIAKRFPYGLKSLISDLREW